MPPKKRIFRSREAILQRRQRMSYERVIRSKLFKLFKEIGKKVSRDYSDNIPISNLFTDLRDRFEGVLYPFYAQVIADYANAAVRALKQTEEQWIEVVEEYINLYGAENVTNISRTTQAILIRSIRKLTEEGASLNDIKRYIKNDFPSFQKGRAALIARTETHNASMFGQFKAAESLEINDLEKEWITINDNRSRSHHKNVNGQRQKMDDDFIVPYKGAEYRMKHPGDTRGGAANVINCRCGIIFVTKDDIVED